MSLAQAVDLRPEDLAGRRWAGYVRDSTRAQADRYGPDLQRAEQRIIVVATPEPTSITDAYALIKVLCRQYGIKRFHLIVNNVTSKSEGDQVAEKLSLVCERFLGDVALEILGSHPTTKPFRMHQGTEGVRGR